MSGTSERKLVAIPNGDGILPQTWLRLTAQPIYATAVEKLRQIDAEMNKARESRQQMESASLLANRIEAETQLIRITDLLHRELEELITPGTLAFVRNTLNALVAFIQWQSILASCRLAVESTGFAPSAVPHRVTIEAILSCDLKAARILLVGQAQISGAITSAEALTLLSGKQIDAKMPSSNCNE